MAKKINVIGDNPCPCYIKIQRSERLDDGTESYRIYELTDETRDRIRQYSDWRVGTIPQKRASGQINIFTSLDGATYPNALSYLKAIAKGITYTMNNDAEDIAKDIINQFPDTSIEDLTQMIERYKEYDCWLESPFVSEEIFTNLEDFLIDFELLNDYVPYKDLVNNFYNE